MNADDKIILVIETKYNRYNPYSFAFYSRVQVYCSPSDRIPLSKSRQKIGRTPCFGRHLHI